MVLAQLPKPDAGAVVQPQPRASFELSRAYAREARHGVVVVTGRSPQCSPELEGAHTPSLFFPPRALNASKNSMGSGRRTKLTFSSLTSAIV